MFVQVQVGDIVLDTASQKIGEVLKIDREKALATIISKEDDNNKFVFEAPLSSIRAVRLETPSDTKKKTFDSDNPYHLVKEFHEKFQHPLSDSPTVMDFDTAYNRSKWVLEELIEHLASTDIEKLHYVRERLHRDLDTMIDTEITKAKNSKTTKRTQDVLLNQIDALVDQLYFVYGSFVVQGVDPKRPFEIVHNFNMDKLDNGEIVYKDAEMTKIGKRVGWLPPDEELKKEINYQKEGKSNK